MKKSREEGKGSESGGSSGSKSGGGCSSSKQGTQSSKWLRCQDTFSPISVRSPPGKMSRSVCRAQV